jgi:hypothetical protein
LEKIAYGPPHGCALSSPLTWSKIVGTAIINNLATMLAGLQRGQSNLFEKIIESFALLLLHHPTTVISFLDTPVDSKCPVKNQLGKDIWLKYITFPKTLPRGYKLGTS